MRKRYKDKKSSGCGLCKPWKHGWQKRIKDRELVELKEFERSRRLANTENKICQ